MDYMKEIAGPLVDSGLVAAESIIGCTDREIDELTTVQSVAEIPTTYRDFLKFSGRDPYWLSRGGEWDFNWLLEAKEVAREIVEEDYGESFSPYVDTFVFQTHQGYMFNYFRSDDLAADDPYFWIYTGGRPLRRSTARFTDWIRELAQTLPKNVALRNQLHRHSGDASGA
ncbi:hypothetical protein [Nocardia mangyaensis]|uniref:hypothetical protein n=1 Tax=Nocardia mangyaensis TaxID=2213200 RepID=UPI00267718C6|nr:hypothetical protein [Nocardia mangyaensis]MDO3651215.1 hypothetical protein [Nocardia mangyaensis]